MTALGARRGHGTPIAYLQEGGPRYCYNLLGVQRFYVQGDTEVPSGTYQVRMEFDYDGGGLGRGRTSFVRTGLLLP